jgi:outer membrane lipoprotein carrier protein
MESWGPPTAPSHEKYWLRPSRPNRRLAPPVYTPVMHFYLALIAAAVLTPANTRAASPAPVAAPASAAGSAESAGQLVAKIQKFYDSSHDLHAHFEQVLESGMGGKKKASGEVWLKKPGRMRWDYAKPERKLMVSDGQTLWVYEPEDEQAFKQDLRSSTLPLSVSFLVGQGKLGEEFVVTVVQPEGVGQPGERVLKLVPKTATAAYRYLLFVVDPKSGLVRSTLIYDQQGGTNHLTFSNVETNRGVEDSKFKFSPPQGTKILGGAGRTP